MNAIIYKYTFITHAKCNIKYLKELRKSKNVNNNKKKK